jgi:hypothetical protein
MDRPNVAHEPQKVAAANVSADQLIEMLLALLQGLKDGSTALFSTDNLTK